MAGGVVHIPWYATGFRGDALQEALAEIAALSLRYNATRYEVFRGRDDKYKLLQIVGFEDKADFERYWYGPEFSEFRTRHSSWYQVPVLYQWQDSVVSGRIERNGNGNGGNGGGTAGPGNGSGAVTESPTSASE